MRRWQVVAPSGLAYAGGALVACLATMLVEKFPVVAMVVFAVGVYSAGDGLIRLRGPYCPACRDAEVSCPRCTRTWDLIRDVSLVVCFFGCVGAVGVVLAVVGHGSAAEAAAPAMMAAAGGLAAAVLYPEFGRRRV